MFYWVGAKCTEVWLPLKHDIISYKRIFSWKCYFVSETMSFMGKKRGSMWMDPLLPCSVKTCCVLEITGYSHFCICWNAQWISLAKGGAFLETSVAFFTPIPSRKKKKLKSPKPGELHQESSKATSFVAGTKHLVVLYPSSNSKRNYGELKSLR